MPQARNFDCTADTLANEIDSKVGGEVRAWV